MFELSEAHETSSYPIFVRCYYGMPLFLIITFRQSPVVPLFALIIRWLWYVSYIFISSARWYNYSMLYFIRFYPDRTSYYLFFVIPNEFGVEKRSYLHFLHMNQPAGIFYCYRWYAFYLVVAYVLCILVTGYFIALHTLLLYIPWLRIFFSP